MIQSVFGYPVDVSAYQDFGFLLHYGEPFWCQVRPSAGQVCFGMESARYGRLLIKFAGAPLNGGLAPEAAALRLQQAARLYELLYPHPALVKLQGHGPAAGGYAAIFRWPEGESLRGEAAQETLRRQPLLTRLRMLDRVFDFQLNAVEQGYMPVGFDEGSLTADFTAGQITVCDIDLYRPLPAINDQGRMEGSPRFLSPEETTLGAALDDVTAQYALGALACFFLSRYGSGERQDWEAGDGLYQAAVRACQEKREKRFSSLADFVQTWRQEAGKAFRHTIS